MFPLSSIKATIDGSRWKLFCILVVGVAVLDGSSNNTLDTTLKNGKIESALDVRSLIPINQPLFNRRINAFQRANQRKDARQRLPVEVVPIVAMYIYYGWMNLVNAFEVQAAESRPYLMDYLLRCEKAGPEVLKWCSPCTEVTEIELNRAGELVKFRMSDRIRKVPRRVFRDCSKLPATLTALDLSFIGLSHLDTRILPRGLQGLCLSFNALETLDLQGLPRRLSFLWISGNPLNHLDFSALPRELRILHLQKIGLMEFELNCLPERLEALDLSGNLLDRLNITESKTLDTIYLQQQVPIQVIGVIHYEGTRWRFPSGKFINIF